MKTYMVYVDGDYVFSLKAKDHNTAEKKARAIYRTLDAFRISVVYTEV